MAEVSTRQMRDTPSLRRPMYVYRRAKGNCFSSRPADTRVCHRQIGPTSYFGSRNHGEQVPLHRHDSGNAVMIRVAVRAKNRFPGL